MGRNDNEADLTFDTIKYLGGSNKVSSDFEARAFIPPSDVIGSFRRVLISAPQTYLELLIDALQSNFLRTDNFNTGGMTS